MHCSETVFMHSSSTTVLEQPLWTDHELFLMFYSNSRTVLKHKKSFSPGMPLLNNFPIGFCLCCEKGANNGQNSRMSFISQLNPIALRKAKIECNRVNVPKCHLWDLQMQYTAAFIRRNQLLQVCRAAQPGLIRWLGPLWSPSVIKLVWVLFDKCTTLLVTKSWPMETRLPCGDQWKAGKLGPFWRWVLSKAIELDWL